MKKLIFCMIIVLTSNVAVSGINDELNRIREKTIDKVGDAVLGPSAVEQLHQENRKRAHEEKLQKERLAQEEKLQKERLAHENRLKDIQIAHENEVEKRRREQELALKEMEQKFQNDMAILREEKQARLSEAEEKKKKEDEAEKRRQEWNTVIFTSLIAILAAILGALAPKIYSRFFEKG